MYTEGVAAPFTVERHRPGLVSSLSRPGHHLLPDPDEVAQGGFHMDDFYRCNIDFVDFCDAMGLDVSRMFSGGSDPRLLADQREMCRRLFAAGHSLTLAAEVMGRQRGFALKAVRSSETWEPITVRCARCGGTCVGKCEKMGGRWSWSTVVT